MGTERFYKLGSFYRIDDRTGFATRAERTSTEWNGLIVSDRVYERRHPQDFVKGVPDNQTVPFPRPRQPNTFVGTSTSAQVEVYGDLPTGPSLYVQSGSITVNHASSIVDPSKFPSGF